MSKQTEKVRRYQAPRVRLPNITLTTVDRANLDACIVRHGTTAEAVKAALAWMLDRLLLKNPEPSRYERGERFRLVKDHSLLRYFIVRREDVSSLPKYCTVEHIFPDGRHAIHEGELVVSARALRLHPSYLKRLAEIHICDLRGTFARMAMLESGLLKADDDYQLVDLILAMVERDRRRDRQEQAGNDD